MYIYQELGFHTSCRVPRNFNVKKLLKKPSVTSTLVVCKSPIHIFKRMVVIYRSMEHHLTYTVSMLLKRFPTNSISLFITFKKKNIYIAKIILSFSKVINKKVLYVERALRIHMERWDASLLYDTACDITIFILVYNEELCHQSYRFQNLYGLNI